MATRTPTKKAPVRSRQTAIRDRVPAARQLRAPVMDEAGNEGMVVDAEPIRSNPRPPSRDEALRQAIESGDLSATPDAWGMAPAAPFIPDYSDPVDLGEYDERFRGCMIVVDLTIPTGVIRQLQTIINKTDKSPEANVKRAAALRDYVRQSVAYWNLTKLIRTASGYRVVALRQPGEGGVDDVPLKDVLQVIVTAVESQFKPTKN